MRTQRMFSVLRKAYAESAAPTLSYKALASATQPSAARRRVVAGCFQELLFLSTHGLVSLTQDRPYGDILVAKTERFDRTNVADGSSQR